ncbi:MAG TPA: ABC transporter permease [Gammaproteobacteria bacterium]|nr:ABC transporter permease [Gammaproteobacteria bacterium]
MIRVIAARELKSLFLSPLAWAVLAVTQFLFAYMFLTQLEVYARNQARLAGLESAPGVTELVAAPLYSSAGVVLLLLAPLLTMRLIAEERRNDTLTLLLSAPINATEIVLGKFAGLMSFFLLMIAMLTLMPLSLSAGTSLDFGQLGACVLALLMLLAAFSALGIFISALTAQPMVAGIGTFGALLLLWIIDWASTTGSSDKTSALFGYLSLDHHYQPLLSGVFSSADAGYFVLFTVMFLALAVWRVDADRLQI